jgi:hypothetical protein
MSSYKNVFKFLLKPSTNRLFHCLKIGVQRDAFLAAQKGESHTGQDRTMRLMKVKPKIKFSNHLDKKAESHNVARQWCNPKAEATCLWRGGMRHTIPIWRLWFQL